MSNVTLALTGAATGSTLSDASGNYQFSALPNGGTYTVTPSKAPLTPGVSSINTLDVLAVQRHFLMIGSIPPGCRLLAANVNGDSGINTLDVIAIQRFFIAMPTGIANVGKYNFVPVSRTLSDVANDQTGQDFDTFIFGDVASPFVNRPTDSTLDPGTSAANFIGVAEVTLPRITFRPSQLNMVAAVAVSPIDAERKLVGFQGDFTFDERVVSFATDPVQKAGLTAGNWVVVANVLPGRGHIRTLRVSAYSNDFRPLSGSGTLFELNVTGVSKKLRSAPLTWAKRPHQFIFIDSNLNVHSPRRVPAGSVTFRLKDN